MIYIYIIPVCAVYISACESYDLLNLLVDLLLQELLQLQRDGITASGTSGGGGPNVSRLNKKIEELQAKLMEKTEQLLEIHQGKAQVQFNIV